jgi:hypothetical protein
MIRLIRFIRTIPNHLVSKCKQMIDACLQIYMHICLIWLIFKAHTLISSSTSKSFQNDDHHVIHQTCILSNFHTYITYTGYHTRIVIHNPYEISTPSFVLIPIMLKVTELNVAIFLTQIVCTDIVSNFLFLNVISYRIL